MKSFSIKYLGFLVVFILTTSCTYDPTNDDDMKPPISSLPDFSGNYLQIDFIGRPETTLNYITNPQEQDQFNQITVKEQSEFANTIKERLIQMHQIFDATYETNYLGLDLDQFSALMANNVMQVSLEEESNYRNFVGRTLKDDVIDVMLSQMFGGISGDRFNGQDTNGDGIPDLPILVTDNRDARFVNPSETFPYLEAPYQF